MMMRMMIMSVPVVLEDVCAGVEEEGEEDDERLAR